MKITSYTKNLILASLTMFSLCACSPKEDSPSINVQELIPANAKIAFSLNSNQNIINELRAKAEYKEIIVELKANNSKLEELYNGISMQLAPEQKEILESFINTKDIVGSLENLVLNQNISLSYSQSSIMGMLQGGDNTMQLAIKIPNSDLANKIVSTIKQNSKVKQEIVDGNTLFVIDTNEQTSLFICKVADVFLFTLSKEHMQNIFAKIQTPTTSILDSDRFKECISNANSDVWAYVDIEDISKLLAIVRPDINLASLKSIGAEISAKSLNAANIEAKLSFKDNTLIDIYSTYSDFKAQAQAINIYDDAVLYASLKLPQISKVTNQINSLGLNQQQLFFASMLQGINAIDITMARQDIKAFTEQPRMMANAYTENSATTKAFLGQIFAPMLTKVGNVDVFKLPKANIAFLPNERISIITASDDAETSLAIATSGKINEAITAKINEIDMENCILELYLDANFFQKVGDANNALKQQVGVQFFKELNELLADAYKKNDLMAKLGITENSIHLIAISETEADFGVIKKILNLLLK